MSRPAGRGLLAGMDDGGRSPEHVLLRARGLLNGDTAVILLRMLEGDEAEQGVLRARAAVGLDDDERQRIRVPIGSGFAGRIALERLPLILNDMDFSTLASPYLREKGIHSLVGVPLLANHRLLGVLHVGSVRPRNFTQEDVALLTLAAERIALGVEAAARRDIERVGRAQAEAANRAKDEFLALLAHELRTPLAAVRNGVLTAQVDHAQRDRALEIAGRQSLHLVRLVDDLLDVARITQGKILLRREPIRLDDIVQRAAETVRPLVEERAQTLSVSHPAGGSGVLDADPARLEQIVENLLTNAAKYTRRAVGSR
jgi:signal transduction histidine kinase